MIKWKRPSGSEVETNSLPGTIQACEKMGWKRIKKTNKKLENTLKSLKGNKSKKGE
jgi:hypothetical protein